jgi:hypothetical protein
MRSWRLGVLLLLLFAVRGEAHKPITSKYTYNEDVFPILDARCGRCHMAGGIAPMSLLTYKEAVPWAESMHIELTANHMPPWYLDDDPHRLSSRELDILLTWATGGTPEGPAKRLSPAAFKNVWKLGKPDLLLQTGAAFTLGADTMEDTHDVLLQSAGETDRWIRAIDVRPGTAAVVRDVTIYAKSATDEKNVAWWFPGDEPTFVPANAAFRWPAATELRARIHYRKTWTYDGKAVTDRTSVAVYLLNHAPLHEMSAWTPRPEASVLDHDVQVFAVRLDGGKGEQSVDVAATRPDGSKLELMHLVSRPDWNRWYSLPTPITLSKGSHIDTAGGSDVYAWLEVLDVGK